MAYTGLPFVFAAWASKIPVDPEFIRILDRAQEAGIKAIPDIARDWSIKMNLSEAIITDYLTRNISYPFTERKKAGMDRFFSIIRSRS
jgi:chorismate dehydratase